MLSSASYAHNFDKEWNEAVYQQQTLGDLDAALAIYNKIIENAEDRKLVAFSMLNAAQCHVQLGDELIANALYETLKKDYSDIDGVQAYLSQQGRSPYLSPDELLPVPWQDGEVLQFTNYNLEERPFGYAVRTKTLTEVEGERAWQTDILFVSDQSNQFSHQEVESLEKSSAPIRYENSSYGIVYATIDIDKGKVTFENPHRGQKFDFEYEDNSYMGLEIDEIVRRLPLSEHYETRIKAIYPGNIGYFDVEIKVTDGNAELEFDGKSVEAWVLQVTSLSHKGDVLWQQQVWVGKDERRLPLKGEGKMGSFVLSSADSNAAKQTSHFKVGYTSRNLNFELPPGWFGFTVYGRNDESQRAFFYSQDGRSSAVLGWKKDYEFDWSKDPLSKKTDESIKWAEGFVSNHEVKKDSFQLLSVAGSEAIRYQASFTGGGHDFIEDRLWIKGDKPIFYSLVFNSSVAAFESERDDHQAILENFSK
ncbi:tetratricopeptide repeat protein [Agaribacterium haliotis]|uniref:tetratricopeptide repeat protein n=1 Tax=Agaribacterium haliotis TaxID=2013869 RepID=UPI000BB55E65|nr:tetratricopeptide repeat protein [Agaribacterium haliotis]